MKRLVLFSSMFVSGVALATAANFGKTTVTSIVSRDTGYHDVYFSSAIPSQGCSMEDRAVLDESLVGGKSMLSVLLSSLIASKELEIRVDGCLNNRPNIKKVQIYP